MPLPSVESQRIIDWIEVTQQADLEHICQPNSHREETCPVLKRKARAMDEGTPRPKKTKTNEAMTQPLTPSASARLGSQTIEFDLNLPPSRTSLVTTTSRSSSPSKRQREAALEFGNPAIIFLTKGDTRAWKHEHGSLVPLLQELQSSFGAHTFGQDLPLPVMKKAAKIMANIEECARRGATEEQWSDAVVLKALNLARKLSRHKDRLKVINV